MFINKNKHTLFPVHMEAPELLGRGHMERGWHMDRGRIWTGNRVFVFIRFQIIVSVICLHNNFGILFQ
jgi:hypothetical protein